jgi:hypothetical protein
MTHKLAGKHKRTEFTQDDGRRLTSFHFQDIGEGIVEFIICTFDNDMNRHEFVTMLDRENIVRLAGQFEAYRAWFEERDIEEDIKRRGEDA